MKHYQPPQSNLSEQGKIENINTNLQKIKATYENDDFIDYHEMDRLLHIDNWGRENIKETSALKKKYQNEEIYGDTYPWTWTDYNLIRKLGHDLNLTKKDIFYDLGSGYGRVPLYLGVNTKALFKGIEIVSKRINDANKAKNELGISNVDFIEGNVTDFDFSDGNVFFLFNPFSDETLNAVGEKLKEVSKSKKIKIVSIAGSNDYFSKCSDWLESIVEGNVEYLNFKTKYMIFESK